MKLLCLDFDGSAIKHALLENDPRRYRETEGVLSEKGSVKNTFRDQPEVHKASFSNDANLYGAAHHFFSMNEALAKEGL